MFRHRFASAFRAVPTLALAAGLLASALGTPSSVRADLPSEPAARLQINIKNIHIYDDRDWGEGEMSFDAGLYPIQEEYTRNSPRMAAMSHNFRADSGEDLMLERVMPRAGDYMESGASPQAGMPVYAGQHYAFVASMLERDGSVFSANDDMGQALAQLDPERGWDLGTHTGRSVRGNGSPGDFAVTIEIRPAPLPDLRPVNIQVDDRFGSAEKRVCMAVVNSGAADAGPFEVDLHVDKVVAPGGGYSVGGLASGDHVWACVEVALPASGQHVLAAHVDERRARIEFSETNNVYEQAYQGTGPAPAPAATPTPAPSAALPDLTVSAIKVNGRAPDGKDDCKNGRNDIAVVVKNADAAAAGEFAVRLVVDGDDEAKEKRAADLDAGQEREGRFGDVRLREGERRLRAIADAKNSVDESSEANNARTATATCKDDD